MVYIGSKRRIAKYLKPIIEKELMNKKLNTRDTVIYWEPFSGGANLLSKIDWNIKLGSDINEYLIALLNWFKNGKNKFIDVNKDTYDLVKNNKQHYEKWYVGYVGFLCTHGGGWFNGYLKHSKDGKRNYIKEHYNNLLEHSKEFKDITFIARDYKDMVINDAVIYCDIPYRNTKKYNNSNFDYDAFYKWCAAMSKNNNTILLSEYENPDTNQWVEIWSKELYNNGINSYRKDINLKTERLFKWKEQQ